ncbi:MAG: hypothetical protein Kow00121_68100 [Elainellaceae cyanobacterium]
MRKFNLRSPILRVSAIPLTIASLFAAVLPSSSASASTYSSTYRADSEDYQSCASGLLGAGISPEAAAEACSGALYPEDLASCVTRIDGGTAIEASNALSGCRRVRRPVDLASCVVDITNIASEEAIGDVVLDFCRRSLLPLRFSACVVGLRDEIAYPTDEAMLDCIASSNRPREFLPSFVPIEEGIPVTPSQIDLQEDPEPLLAPAPDTVPPQEQPLQDPGL